MYAYIDRSFYFSKIYLTYKEFEDTFISQNKNRYLFSVTITKERLYQKKKFQFSSRKYFITMNKDRNYTTVRTVF